MKSHTDNFPARVDYAAHTLLHGDPFAASFAECFARDDAECVWAALCHRARRNLALREALVVLKGENWYIRFVASHKAMIETRPSMLKMIADDMRSKARHARWRAEEAEQEARARWKARYGEKIPAHGVDS